MIIIGFGANIPSQYGAPEDTIQQGISLLEESGVTVLAASTLYHSAPVPVSSDPWYYNLVVSVETTLSSDKLLNVLFEVEDECGRVRAEKNAPRTLDLDLIAYHDEVLTTPSLTLPHPRAHERAFVMKPIAEIAPEWKHPVMNKTATELLRALAQTQVLNVAS